MFKTIVGALGAKRTRPSSARKRPRASSSTSRTCSTARGCRSLRHRPDRQELPQRDHAAELHLPLARVRADGNRVLLPAQPIADWYQYWRDRRYHWYSTGPGRRAAATARSRLGRAEPLFLGTADIEYAFPFLPPGEFGELEGVAHRGDFDLRSHTEGKLVRRGTSWWSRTDPEGKPRHRGSGQDLPYFDDMARRTFPAARHRAVGRRRPGHAGLPVRGLSPRTRCPTRTANPRAVSSPSFTRGWRRSRRPSSAGEKRRHARGGQKIYRAPEVALHRLLRRKGAVGRRYRRQDEVGTPFCITVDGQTLTDGTVPSAIATR